MERERAVSFELGSSMPSEQPHGRGGWKLQRERARMPRMSRKHVQVLKRRIEKKKKANTEEEQNDSKSQR